MKVFNNVILGGEVSKKNISIDTVDPTTTQDMTTNVFINPTVIDLSIEDVKDKKDFILRFAEGTFNLRYFETNEKYTFIGVNETSERLLKFSVILNEEETEIETIVLLYI